ncbi:hypothetical protein RND81_05G200300 [Saponaria officinalis]|uniref:Uncharacterized protein n=1 Tax=Saponaria officinalis TaxID=3572 RepID=A0AAW1L2P3_SAPOF
MMGAELDILKVGHILLLVLKEHFYAVRRPESHIFLLQIDFRQLESVNDMLCAEHYCDAIMLESYDLLLQIYFKQSGNVSLRQLNCIIAMCSAQNELRCQNAWISQISATIDFKQLENVSLRRLNCSIT